MSPMPLPDRADVLGMLAGYGDRKPEDVNEELGSLELTWLVAQAEQRYAVLLDLSDETFAGMGTVTGALAVLRAEIAAQHGIPERMDTAERMSTAERMNAVEAGHG